MRRNSGFTLIETMVALVIASLVIVVAHALFTQVMDGAVRARAAARDADTGAARRDWLVRVFGSLDADAVRRWGFVGSSNGKRASISFVTLARTGIPAPARVELRLEAADSGLVAHLYPVVGDSTQGLDLVLADSAVSFAADFLIEYGARAQWVQAWISPATAPLAARLRIGQPSGVVDTMLLRIGSRG